MGNREQSGLEYQRWDRLPLHGFWQIFVVHNLTQGIAARLLSTDVLNERESCHIVDKGRIWKTKITLVLPKQPDRSV